MVHLLPFSWPRLLPHGVSMAFRNCRHLSARLQNPPCAFTFARPFFHVPGHACCLSSCSFHPSRFPGHVSCQMVFLWRFGTAGLLHDASLAFRDCQIASFSRVSPSSLCALPFAAPHFVAKMVFHAVSKLAGGTFLHGFKNPPALLPSSRPFLRQASCRPYNAAVPI